METEAMKRTIDNALQMGNDMVKSQPENSSLRMVLEQLGYLKNIYDRDHSFRSVPKGKLTIGVIAAKEFDVNNPKFAELLYQIDYAIDNPDNA